MPGSLAYVETASLPTHGKLKTPITKGYHYYYLLDARIGAHPLDSIHGFHGACMGKLHPEFMCYYFIIGFY